MTGACARSERRLGTIVTIQVVRPDGPERNAGEVKSAVDGAFGWFAEVESRCSRFDETSELRRLAASPPGIPVVVGPLLFEAARFALAVAADTHGAFDPTVGYRMEARGFNRHYRTGEAVGEGREDAESISYADVVLDGARQSITIRRPLLLDLGAVAKGLAIDLAARELAPFEHFAIDAGGDLYLGGLNPEGEPWRVGIRHPRRDRTLIAAVRVSNRAVCTSGDYERATSHGHHLLDARTGAPAGAAISATAIAPSAMTADALATAALLLGPAEGIALLERHAVEGLIVSPTLEQRATTGFGDLRAP